MSQTTAQPGYIYKEPGRGERSRRRRSITIWLGAILFLAGLAMTLIFTGIFIQQAVKTLTTKPVLRSPVLPGTPYQTRMSFDADLLYRGAFMLQVSSDELVEGPKWSELSQSPDYRLLAKLSIKDSSGQLLYTEETLLSPHSSLRSEQVALTQEDGQHVLKVQRSLPEFEIDKSGEYTLEATLSPLEFTEKSGKVQQAEFLIYTESNDQGTGTMTFLILLGTGALLGLLVGIFGALMSLIGMILGAHRLKLILREELARIPRG